MSKAKDDQIEEKKFNKWKNYQAVEEALLIGILNRYCQFTFAKPKKKNNITLKFIQITEIKFSETDKINIAELVNALCKEKSVMELGLGTNSKTVKRRMQNNKPICVVHLLADLLFWFEYNFFPRSAKNKDTFCYVTYKNKALYYSKDIYSIGKSIHTHLLSLLESDKCDSTFVLLQNDVTIQSFLTPKE